MSALAHTNNRVMPPQSLKAVKEMLNTLNIVPPGDDVMLEISKQVGDKFKQALTDSINKEDDWQKSYTYLNNLFFAVSKNTRMLLEQMGFGTIETRRLILIGTSEGDNFRKHLISAKQNNRPTSDMDYLRRIMAIYGGQPLKAPTATTSPLTEKHAEPAQCPQEQPRRQEQQAQQAQRSESSQRPEPPDDFYQSDDKPQRGNVARFPERTSNSAQSEMDLPEQQDDSFLSRHIYGGKNAICLNADEKRNGGDKTVRLEAAVSIGERKYDWKDKISIQLSHQEMMGVFSVLMGWIPNFEGKGHGFQNEKSFSFKVQDHDLYKFYISVNCKDKQSRSVPINALDGARLATFIFGQMIKNEPPGMQHDTYIQFIKHFALLSLKRAG
jgi:hypothetical protein